MNGSGHYRAAALALGLVVTLLVAACGAQTGAGAIVTATVTVTTTINAANTISAEVDTPHVVKTTVAKVPTAASWHPADMKERDDLAWKWSHNEVKCESFYAGCWGITIVTQYGCPSGVYVELGILDSSGAIVGKANTITAGLGPGDTAKAAIGTTDDSARQAKLTQLQCMG